jgi:arsenate reductase
MAKSPTGKPQSEPRSKPAKTPSAKPAPAKPGTAKAVAGKPKSPAKPATPKPAPPPTAAPAGEVTIWHNPACGASENALAYLQKKGVAPAIYLYLKEKPGKAEIKALLKTLGIKASELLRPAEAKGEALGLYAGASEAAIIEAMAAEPVLIQRPVVITAKGARIARPKARIDEIL